MMLEFYLLGILLNGWLVAWAYHQSRPRRFCLPVGLALAVLWPLWYAGLVAWALAHPEETRRIIRDAARH